MKTFKTGEDLVVVKRPNTNEEWNAPRNLTIEVDSKSTVISIGDRIFLGMERCESGKNSGGIDEVYAVVKDFDIDDIIHKTEDSSDWSQDWPVEITYTVSKLTL